jgi:hypothetical protein
LLAVSKPFEVIVPPDVVVRSPIVVRFPSSVITRLSTPPDWITRESFTTAFVSSIITARPVPSFRRVKDVATPVSDDSSYKVNAISRPVVVSIVFPVLYAA